MIVIPFGFEGETKYQSYSELTDRVRNFPKYNVIGKDQSGQFDMFSIHLGVESKPAILMTSAMHGTEWQGAQYSLSFMEQLKDNTFPDENLRNQLLNNFHLILIPVVNPWGLNETTEYAQTTGRRNSAGIDLNRDFDEFTQMESINTKKVMDKYRPFAYLDLHLQGSGMEGNQGNNLIIGNGQTATANIRDIISNSLEKYAGQPVTRWDGFTNLTPGLSRRYMRDQINSYTPYTLSYISELTRPIQRSEGLDAPLTDREIYKFGMAAIYLFYKTSIDYFSEYNKITEVKLEKTMYVRNLKSEEFALQAKTTHELELNGNQSISFTILPTKVNNEFINEISEMWEVIDVNGVIHKVIYAKKKGEGTLLNVDIKAVPLFFDVLDNARIYEEYNEHMPAQRAFSRIFSGLPFQFILVGQFDAVEWEGFGAGESRLETFKRALERYKMEFRIDGNIVYLERQIGRDTSFMYRYKLNASNIVKEIDANEYWTFAKGYGNYGNEGEGDGESSDWQDAKLIREYTSPLAKIVGVRHAPPIKDGRVTVRSTMDDALKTLVNESLKISISADIIDLRRQGYDLAQPELGDRVFVIDERIGLDEEVRVISISITKDWRDNVVDMKLTIGSEGVTKRHQSNMSTAVNAINELIEGRRELPFSVLDEAVRNATKALQNTQTELLFGSNGIIAKDKQNPNYLTIFNSAGIGVSVDGGNSFREAITGRGINASAVVTGTMVADFIAGGTLASLNGRTNFDLNSGLLDMENTQFRLGGGARIDFTSSGNTLTYELLDSEDTLRRTSGIGVGKSINDRFPVIYMGTTGTGRGNFSALDERYFNGFIANTRARSRVDNVGNSVVGNIFHVRDQAIEYKQGFSFDLSSGRKVFYPMSTGDYNYDIGAEGNRFDRIWVNRMRVPNDFIIQNVWNTDIGWRMETQYSGDGHGISLYPTYTGSYQYVIGKKSNRLTNVFSENFSGTLSSESSHNAKMGIENVDSQAAFDYIKMTKIKTYFYKNSDYTDKFNRKVSPIIEQLDPTIENLYKSTDHSLDINSNLFLLVQAFQHYMETTDEKIKQLEAQNE